MKLKIWQRILGAVWPWYKANLNKEIREQFRREPILIRINAVLDEVAGIEENGWHYENGLKWTIYRAPEDQYFTVNAPPYLGAKADGAVERMLKRENWFIARSVTPSLGLISYKVSL